MKTFKEYSEYAKNSEDLSLMLMFTESLDTRAEVTYKPAIKDSGSTFIAGTFLINDKKFTITFEVLEEHDALGVNFSQQINNKQSHMMLSNLTPKETLEVFGTLVYETNKQLKKKKYHLISFEANDVKKLNLYHKIIKKYMDISKYNLVVSDNSVLMIHDSLKDKDMSYLKQLKYKYLKKEQ